ncbi:hypothetical protein C8J57DRAFT_1613376 [Mycena rebaudengoi]|nr:hypothetical protein C8J57DRAFT_1613376 [Mycena rebaudengoi]
MPHRLCWKDPMRRTTLRTIVKKVIPLWTEDGLRSMQEDLVAPILDRAPSLTLLTIAHSEFSSRPPAHDQLTSANGGTCHFVDTPRHAFAHAIHRGDRRGRRALVREARNAKVRETRNAKRKLAAEDSSDEDEEYDDQDDGSDAEPPSPPSPKPRKPRKRSVLDEITNKKTPRAEAPIPSAAAVAKEYQPQYIPGNRRE